MIKKSRFFFPRTFWVLQYELRSGPSQRQRWRTINSRDDWKSHQNTSEKPKRILPVCRRYLGCISILILLLNWITKSQVEAKADGDKWKTLLCLFAKFWPFINRTGPGFEGLFYIVARVQKIAKQWQVKKNLPTTHPLSCRNIQSVSFMPSPTKEHKERISWQMSERAKLGLYEKWQGILKTKLYF